MCSDGIYFRAEGREFGVIAPLVLGQESGDSALEPAFRPLCRPGLSGLSGQSRESVLGSVRESEHAKMARGWGAAIV